MRDDVQIQRDAARLGVAFDDAGIADQDRIAGRAHGGIERGLQADLRPDAGGIAGGDGDPGLVLIHRVFSSTWQPDLYHEYRTRGVIWVRAWHMR